MTYTGGGSHIHQFISLVIFHTLVCYFYVPCACHTGVIPGVEPVVPWKTGLLPGVGAPHTTAHMAHHGGRKIEITGNLKSMVIKPMFSS